MKDGKVAPEFQQAPPSYDYIAPAPFNPQFYTPGPSTQPPHPFAPNIVPPPPAVYYPQPQVFAPVSQPQYAFPSAPSHNAPAVAQQHGNLGSANTYYVVKSGCFMNFKLEPASGTTKYRFEVSLGSQRWECFAEKGPTKTKVITVSISRHGFEFKIYRNVLQQHPYQAASGTQVRFEPVKYYIKPNDNWSDSYVYITINGHNFVFIKTSRWYQTKTDIEIRLLFSEIGDRYIRNMEEGRDYHVVGKLRLYGQPLPRPGGCLLGDKHAGILTIWEEFLGRVAISQGPNLVNGNSIVGKKKKDPVAIVGSNPEETVQILMNVTQAMVTTIQRRGRVKFIIVGVILSFAWIGLTFGLVFGLRGRR
ncbi:hypothetical protein BKA69DRAFT_250957 [Paraphysoderma sedebokerense]|nr:hypothetical protein BKA69DRAFT_250957 [Paraphysoderma sedebokerense]